MNFKKALLVTLALTLANPSHSYADDVGVDIPAVTYNFESAPDDPTLILDMGSKVGWVRTQTNSFEYWAYEDFDFGDGATHLTVRASSNTQGGTLHVRLANHYNPSLTIATVEITNTGGWNKFEDFTVEVDQDVIDSLGGGRPLFFVVENDGDEGFLFDVESFRFDNANATDDCLFTTNAENYTIEAFPSYDDIIRDMGTKVGYITGDGWIRYDGVDVGTLANSISVRASSGSTGGTLYVTSDAPYGFGAATLLATVEIESTGGWNAFSDFTANLETPIGGIVGNLFLSFDGDSTYLFDLESFSFCSQSVSDIGVEINAATYSFESAPDDDSVIYDMGDRVGFVRADRAFTYWGYEGFDFGNGASTLTVRASSGSTGGTLYVQLFNHYNPELTVATIDIPNTGGWDSFQEFTVPVNQEVIEQFNGANLFFVVTDEDTSNYQFDLQSFRFDN